MLDRIINESNFLALVRELARSRRIVAPVRRGDRYFYDDVDDVSRLDLGFNYCVYGPRGYLFPPVETLFRFNMRDHRFEAEPVLESVPTAFVGVHPCDIHAIRLLDHVFSSRYRDEHYLVRRALALIVGVDCPQPCTEGVFCSDMKTNEANEGFDVMLFPLGEATDGGGRRYGVRFGSKQGREWMLYSRKCTVPTAGDERKFEEYHRTKVASFPRALRTPIKDLPDLLGRSYDSLLWEATARRCYSCGSCNLSCPTCYCFNILDELDMSLTAGARRREWDGCQLEGFGEVAGGHNFRPRAASRLRHRIYRKAKWVREQTGLPGCVGCARCDRACTAKINSVEIYNQLAEEEV